MKLPSVPLPIARAKSLVRPLPDLPAIWALGLPPSTPSRQHARFPTGLKLLGLLATLASVWFVLAQKRTTAETASVVVENSAKRWTPLSPRSDHLVRVSVLTYCSSLPQGVEAYDQWTRHPEVGELTGLMRQYGGELVAPGQQLEVIEKGPTTTQLRTLRSKTICYLPTGILH